MLYTILHFNDELIAYGNKFDSLSPGALLRAQFVASYFPPGLSTTLQPSPLISIWKA